MTTVDVKMDAAEESHASKRDDIDNLLGYLAYFAEKDRGKGAKDHLPVMPDGVDEREAPRVAIKSSGL
jgi:hypothetical protein